MKNQWKLWLVVGAASLIGLIMLPQQVSSERSYFWVSLEVPVTPKEGIYLREVATTAPPQSDQVLSSSESVTESEETEETTSQDSQSDASSKELAHSLESQTLESSEDEK